MSKETKKPFRQSVAEWRQFVYNPNSGEFLGRTAKSWGLILLFYLVFYGFLAALFTFTMWVMLQTLSNDIPKYRDRISSPGLMISPKPDTALEFYFNKSDAQSYAEYVSTLRKFLESKEGVPRKNALSDADLPPTVQWVGDFQAENEHLLSCFRFIQCLAIRGKK
uniref:Sodium/potassium-transporting ATPase subunit beta-3 n=1 Tax=Pavo cristatus TaxID=9049 RepID=A0A8C9FYY8_PAVCR